MDLAAAWSKTLDTTKSARVASAEMRVNALDALSPLCAPFAARWDAEADRRLQLRTQENLKALLAAQREHNSARATSALAGNQRRAARAASRNPLSTARRSARVAHRAAKQQHDQARAELRAAKAKYPSTLKARAAQLHATHATGAGIASWAMTEAAHHLTLWPAPISLGFITANAAALWLGRRAVSVRVDDGLSAEEVRLAQRLDPSFWVQHADDRGLSGTVPTPAKLTPAGLVSHVRLDGRWTPKAFRAKEDEIRALLGARTDLRVEIKTGSHGDRATITLRTRSAADGINLSGWTPGAPWGVDTVTGEPVMVPLGRRMLIAGTSGAGKSWSTRALLAEASEAPDHRLVVVDPKRVEAINWQHRARTAITLDEVLDVSDELVAEMHERLALVPRGRDTIEISPERPRITVFVDEGAEVKAMAKTPRQKPTKEDPGDPDWSRIMSNFRTLARMGRAAEIIIIWATQKPTMDEANGGIDAQISAQITYRAALALSTSGEARVVFGEDATDKGWHAHELPMPGVAMLRWGPKAKPHPINTRAFSPADVIALPDRPIWQRGQAAPVDAVPPQRPPLRLVQDEAETLVLGNVAPQDAVPAQETNRVRVLDAVRSGARTAKDVTEATGLNKGTVSREVKALVDAGELVRAEDNTLAIAAEEVSA